MNSSHACHPLSKEAESLVLRPNSRTFLKVFYMLIMYVSIKYEDFAY